MKKKMLWGSTILVIGVICFITYKIGTNFGGVLKSMLPLNEAIIDVNEG